MDELLELYETMGISPAAELQRLLEQAGFRRIRIHKTSRWLCLTAQKPD